MEEKELMEEKKDTLETSDEVVAVITGVAASERLRAFSPSAREALLRAGQSFWAARKTTLRALRSLWARGRSRSRSSSS